MDAVLSEDEWAKAKDDDAMDDIVVGNNVHAYVSEGDVGIALLEPGKAAGIITEPTKLIALLNDALPDDDARKITRAKLERIRAAVRYMDREHIPGNELDGLLALGDFADALLTYLPREK